MVPETSHHISKGKSLPLLMHDTFQDSSVGEVIDEVSEFGKGIEDWESFSVVSGLGHIEPDFVGSVQALAYH